MKKRGRPPKVDSRKRQYRLRLTEKEYEKIEFLAIQRGKTFADILREGVDLLYNIENFS